MHVSSFAYFKKFVHVCVCVSETVSGQRRQWLSFLVHTQRRMRRRHVMMPTGQSPIDCPPVLSSFGGGEPPQCGFFTESGNFQRVATFALFREIGASRFFGGEVSNGHLVLSMDGSICFVFGGVGSVF